MPLLHRSAAAWLAGFPRPGPLKNKKFLSPKFEILDALRLKIFKEFDTKDALRYKAGRVSLDNVPRGLFSELCATLQQWEAHGGQQGEALWRRHKITKIRDGFNCRSSFAITTVGAANVLLNLSRVEPDLESSLEYASGLLKISNFRFGDVKFVDLPIQLEQVSSTSYGITKPPNRWSCPSESG